MVCLATPERSMIASIPTACTPRCENSSYAALTSRSRASLVLVVWFLPPAEANLPTRQI
jgi:hypothetical protein